MRNNKLLLAILCLGSAASFAQDSLLEAITGGKPDVFLRYRFERVEDGTPGLLDAKASTLRTAIGYQTRSWHNFSIYLQAENVTAIGAEQYNDGGSNGVTNRAVVVDPEGTEMNQAWLRYSGIPKTVATAGRQDITHRDAPLHRYIGNVLFRQNWQSYDALRLTNLALPQTTIDYAYVWNVNRIFGEDNPLPDRSDFPMNSHLLQVLYGGLPWGKLEGYAYLLEFDNAVSRRFSTSTLGLRLQGDRALGAKAKLLYTAEAARQADYGNNPNNISANYYLGELGVSRPFGGRVESASVKLSYEFLEGSGGVNAFQTPLGTNHAFQGFADRFLVTPGDGIRDVFLTAAMRAFGVQTQLIYHKFSSDRGGYDYGDEWDFILEKSFAKRFLVGLKLADYQADANAANIAANSGSGQAFDLTKYWAYVQFKY